MANRYILAIDNSMDFLNLALIGPNGSIDARRVKESRSPSQILAENIKKILTDNDVSLNDITELRVSLGPGSFTGIRVALSFCKGIHAATDIPIRGIPTLDALAFALMDREDMYLCPLIDAKKSEVFTALYHVSGQRLYRQTNYMALKPEGLPPIIKTPCMCFGTGLRIAENYLSEIEGITMIRDSYDDIRPEALVDARMDVILDSTKIPLNPIYGRRSEAEIKFNITID